MHTQLDERVLAITLRRLGFTLDILKASRTPGNVEAKGRLMALLRAARTPQCHQMTWTRIAAVCNFRNHTTPLFLAKRFESKCGEVSPWDAIKLVDGQEVEYGNQSN